MAQISSSLMKWVKWRCIARHFSPLFFKFLIRASHCWLLYPFRRPAVTFLEVLAAHYWFYLVVLIVVESYDDSPSDLSHYTGVLEAIILWSVDSVLPSFIKMLTTRPCKTQFITLIRSASSPIFRSSVNVYYEHLASSPRIPDQVAPVFNNEVNPNQFDFGSNFRSLVSRWVKFTSLFSGHHRRVVNRTRLTIGPLRTHFGTPVNSTSSLLFSRWFHDRSD